MVLNLPTYPIDLEAYLGYQYASKLKVNTKHMALSPTTSRNLGPLNQLQIQVLALAHKDTHGNV